MMPPISTRAATGCGESRMLRQAPRRETANRRPSCEARREARRAASSSASGLSNSAMQSVDRKLISCHSVRHKPAQSFLVASSCNKFAHLEDRNHRQEANEQKQQARQNSPIDPDRTCLVPDRAGIHAPRRRQKSRCRLMTTMTKRSSHMPMLTTIAMHRTAQRIGAHAREPEHLRHQDVAQNQQPSTSSA